MTFSDVPDETPDAAEPGARIRLQRFLAQCGLGSRRACEQFILDGRVSVDGQTIAELGATVDPQSQTIALDGERLRIEHKRYYLVHKPTGFLCTNYDPAGRRRVIDLFPPGGPRLFTVGRLDENSSGLLIVTNDGDLAQKLAHPKFQIFRTYHVQVAGRPKRAVFDQLEQGLYFQEGKFRVRSVRPLKKVGESTWLEVVLSEGQNRELRRLFARVGHKVLKLQRVAFGAVRLGKLKPGEYRDLLRGELAALHGLVERGGGGVGDPRRAKRRMRGADKEGRRPRRPSGDQERAASSETPGQRGGDGRRRTGPPPRRQKGADRDLKSREKPSRERRQGARRGAMRGGQPDRLDRGPRKEEAIDQGVADSRRADRGRPRRGKAPFQDRRPHERRIHDASASEFGSSETPRRKGKRRPGRPQGSRPAKRKFFRKGKADEAT